MDHFKQHDWCFSNYGNHFLKENDINNCATEKILRNKFRDPLISSESEDDGQAPIKINWDEILNKKQTEKTHRIIVPGLHPIPPHPKLSAMSIQQHYQCLKVLCAENPNILPAEFIPRPTKQDRKVFEDIKEIYAKEQLEFKEWAKTLWTSNHCVRALRPKPTIEMVYEAEFKVRAHEMESFPKNYTMAAQIPLETVNAKCELVADKELISVNITSLPKINIPDMTERVFVIKPYPVPEPCSKHPCRFYLPSESSMTVLPLTEVHKELAQYAMDNGARHIASEEGLRCLMELDRSWLLALSVCEVIGQDGPCRAVVVGGEAASREAARARTRRALRPLLLHALAPPVEMSTKKRASSTTSPSARPSLYAEPDSSDDENNLYIDFGDTGDIDNNSSEKNLKEDEKTIDEKADSPTPENATTIDYSNCTCKDTFDQPPSRSYKKWKVVNRTSNDTYNLIVHCPHQVQGQAGEVVVDSIAEYQADVAAARPEPGATAATALSLLLRTNASALNVRVDNPSGEIVRTEWVSRHEVSAQGGTAAGRVFTAIDQLQGLRPGHYLLHHEPSHGSNAILYASSRGCAAGALRLERGVAEPASAAFDEARDAAAAPELTTTLLPFHKFRKILPCAFTPFNSQLAREPRRPPARQRTPPQAIKWPKKKNKKKKKNNNNN